ncbi:unnamed protein product, partial [Discosporangium mesarthrocarpum]
QVGAGGSAAGAGAGEGVRAEKELMAEVEVEGEADMKAVLTAMERLQEAVRVCYVGKGGAPSDQTSSGSGPSSEMMTLSEEELRDPHRLMAGLELCSSWGVMTRKGGEDGCGDSETFLGFLRRPLGEAEARRLALQPEAAPLYEMGWLADKAPGATLGDLLANRLELSLWASYWKMC